MASSPMAQACRNIASPSAPPRCSESEAPGWLSSTPFAASGAGPSGLQEIGTVNEPILLELVRNRRERAGQLGAEGGHRRDSRHGAARYRSEARPICPHLPRHLQRPGLAPGSFLHVLAAHLEQYVELVVAPPRSHSSCPAA